MDKLKVVYLCSNAEFPLAVFYANNFSLATKLDRLSRQGKIETQVNRGARYRWRLLLCAG
jgi:hypothetical protein